MVLEQLMVNIDNCKYFLGSSKERIQR